MAIGIIFDVPGGTQAQYDRIMVELNLQQRPAAGLLSHTAGPSANGWRVVDVWDDQTSFDNFLQSRLGPAIASSGIPQPSIATFTVYNQVRGA
jgi:hypothetical protein